MAVLAANQYHVAYADGACGKTALYSVKNCTAGDTMDVASEFSVVKRAGIVSDTGTHIASVANTGTVLTIPAGPANDGVWMLVVGVAK